jgi:hypothetical protein
MRPIIDVKLSITGNKACEAETRDDWAKSEALTDVNVARSRALRCHLFDVDSIFQATVALNAQAGEIGSFE